MRRRFSVVAPLVFALSLVFTAGCGGGDGDDVDAGAGSIDANPNAADASNGGPDAMTNAANALGQPCTPDGAGGPGDCPADHICLQLNGGSGPFCTKTCTAQNDPVCTTDYTGPGVPACVYAIDTNNDMMADFNACAIICEDLGAGICPTCPATCPAPLQCTADLTNGMTTLARACQ